MVSSTTTASIIARPLISASPSTLQCVFEFVRDRWQWVTTRGTSRIRRLHRFLVRVSRTACRVHDGPPALDSRRSKRACTNLRPFAGVFASFPAPPVSRVVRAPLLRLCASRGFSKRLSSRYSSTLFRLAVACEARARDNFPLTKTDFRSRHESRADVPRGRRLNEHVRH